MNGPVSGSPCPVTTPDTWRSWQGTGRPGVAIGAQRALCVRYLRTTACLRMLLSLTGTEKAWMKRDSLLSHHPSPCPTPSLSFCELKYLQSKEMPSRVNKGGAAPAVGGAQLWVGPSGGRDQTLACISLFSSGQELTCVWARFSHWCWEPRRPWEPPLWCMCESLGVHIECKITRDHVINQSKPHLLLDVYSVIVRCQGTIVQSKRMQLFMNRVCK